jgi:uncharacterized membrane protein SpoIIM required for sporulation
MLESILSAEVAERKPWELLFVAIAIGGVATALAALVGQGKETGHLVVAFASIGAAPLLVRLMAIEEEKDEVLTGGHIVARHWPVIEAYGYYFIGIVVIVSLLHVILPGQLVNQVYSSQLDELKAIKALAAGSDATARAVSACRFECLLENNLGVLALVLVFSFLFGSGAVYILTWNASIVGTLIGTIAHQNAAAYGGPVMSYLVALPMSLIAILPHGMFEIGAYFLGGLAGGILSMAIVRGHLTHKQILADVLTITALAVIFVIVGALVESSY